MDPLYATDCSDFGTFSNPPYVLENNTHGKEMAIFTQCVHYATQSGQVFYKWNWTWPYLGSLKVRGYPEVIFGQKPWMPTSTTTALPRKISTISRIDSTFNINSVGTGVFNTAYDLWILTGPTPTFDSSGKPTNIHSEVMIWTDNQGLPPAGGVIGVETTTEGTYNLYRDYFPDWKYLAFVRNVPITSGVLDLREFLTILVNRSEIDQNHYLASVEYGNELSHGTGEATLTGFSVSVL